MKVIEKHFWPLDKEEIAAKVVTSNLELPIFLVERLQNQSPELSVADNLKLFHPYFVDVINEVREGIISADENSRSTPWQKDKLFDQSLFLISVYYQYSAVISDILIADFIRLLLLKKTLLT